MGEQFKLNLVEPDSGKSNEVSIESGLKGPDSDDPNIDLLEYDIQQLKDIMTSLREQIVRLRSSEPDTVSIYNTRISAIEDRIAALTQTK